MTRRELIVIVLSVGLLAGFGECTPPHHDPPPETSCRDLPCGGTDAEWRVWGDACVPEGECQLVYCPESGDNQRTVCNH